jgi:hypothetical protein
MILTLRRFASLSESTLGALAVDGRFACFTLEDQAQEFKIPGETRIPAGEYGISLRSQGGMSPKYASKFPDHRGMLWLRNVPGFEYIYIHVGVDDDDTAGCILVGDTAHSGGTLESSTVAYRRIYGQISNAILAGEPVTIEVKDPEIT